MSPDCLSYFNIPEENTPCQQSLLFNTVYFGIRVFCRINSRIVSQTRRSSSGGAGSELSVSPAMPSSTPSGTSGGAKS